MSFEEVIQKIFNENFFNTISFPEIVINLGLTLLIGIFIYIVYRMKSKSEFYSHEFNVILILLPVITCAIVISMQSNMALSLGMVGALSIVRFRNAVKSSMDLLFLFWAISIGIICGGQLYLLGIILSIVIGIVLIVCDILPNKKTSSLLIVNSSNIYNEEKIIKVVSRNSKYYRIKSKSIHENAMDLIIEVRGKNINDIVTYCSKIKGIENVNLLSHDGDIRL